MEEQLQEKSIKVIFNHFENNRQLSLIRDLMSLAGVDSIIRNNQPVHLGDMEINAPKYETAEAKQKRLYRQLFDAWLYPTLINFLVVIEKSFVDECFQLFEIIRAKAKGTMYCRGATGFYIRNDDPARGGAFADEAAREEYCLDILAHESVDKVALHDIRRQGDQCYGWTVKFADLFTILRNDDINIILLCLGFLDDNPMIKIEVMVKLYVRFFESFSPDDAATAIKQVLINGRYIHDGENVLLTRLFDHFPGLRVIKHH